MRTNVLSYSLKALLAAGFIAFLANNASAQVTRTSSTRSSAVNSQRTLGDTSMSTATNGGNASGAGGSGGTGSFQPMDRGGFVGRSTSNNQTVGGGGGTGTGMSMSRGMGGMGMGGMGMGMGGMGMGGMGGMGRGGMNSQFGQMNNQNDARTKIKATVKIGFTMPRAPVAIRQTAVRETLAQIPLPENLQGLDVSLDGSTAILRGKVATEADKRMAQRLIMLEPGISSVKNELEVGG